MSSCVSCVTRILITAIAAIAGFSSLSAQTISDPAPLLITFSDGARTLEGDHDHRQLVRFSVPLTVSGPLHVRVFDADTGGSYDEMLGRSDTVMDYTLYGGGSTASISRDGDGVLVESVEGKTLGVVEIGRDNKFDGKWSTLFTVDAGDGKIMGDAREFFLLVEGMGGNDGNVFDVRISTNEDANISPRGVKLYSFLPTVRVTKRGHVTELGFVAPENTSSLKIDNFDSARGAITFAGRFRSLPLKASGQDEWQSGTIVLEDNEKGGLVSITLGGGQELPNDVTFFVADDQDQPVAITLPPKSFRSNKRPVIKVSQTPQSCTAMRFDAGGSSDPDGNNLTYRWVFHDGAVMTGASVIRHYRKAGQYSARLEVFDGSGQIGNGTAEELAVFIKAPPVAKLKVPQIVAQGGEFEIDASGSFAPKLGDGSATTLVRYEWDMGNGVKFEGTEPTLKHSYGDYGTHTIKLKVTDSSDHPCNSVTTLATIEINAAPIPNAGGDRQLHTGEIATFDAGLSNDPDGLIISYIWQFGDGHSAYGPKVRHTFHTPGNYQVRLKVADDSGLDEHKIEDLIDVDVKIRKNQRPIARIDGERNAKVGQIIKFDASASTDADGEILGIQWDFGDGSGADRMVVEHTYWKAGTFELSLTLKDNSGQPNNEAVASSRIIVAPAENTNPIIDAPKEISANTFQPVVFDASKSDDRDGSIVSYRWDFGDGTTGSGAVIKHAYLKAGSYRAKLVLKDNFIPVSGVAEQEISVSISDEANLAPKADAGENRQMMAGEKITFDGSRSQDPNGSILAYRWEFGDGHHGRGIAPHHIYQKAGNYQVTLTVTDNNDADQLKETSTMFVSVLAVPNQSPNAEAGGDQEVSSGQIIEFDGTKSSDPDGNITAYHWDFGNGETSTAARPLYAYHDPGRYQVRLQVTDDHSDAASASNTITIVVNKPVKNEIENGESR